MTLPECPEEVIPDCPESAGLRYQRLRAPAEDGAALVVPPFSCVGRMLEANEALRRAADCQLLGKSLQEISRQARAEVLQAAVRYTSAYRSVPAEFQTAAQTSAEHASQRIIAAGHQPELFHPGVWFKNFALSDLAHIHRAIPLNLVIDTDDAKSAAINVPGGSSERPLVRQIAFDEPSSSVVPFEERAVNDPQRFRGFAAAVSEHLQPLIANPLVNEFWPAATERAEATGNLGAALAQSRHLLEESLGLATLELPQSQVCETAAFRWFAGHLFCQAAQFAEAHNAALELYRQVNRVRSQSHPVPNLEQVDGWTETPFWIWTAEAPQRRSLYVKRSGNDVQLSDRAGFETQFPACDGGGVVNALAELSARGVKLRTKALATTMWARLALSDLFLHGIGGAKYDQLNDEIIRRFLGIQSPSFLTVSATFRLPIAEHTEPQLNHEIDEFNGSEQSVDRAAVSAVERELRELEFQPERHISSDLTSRGEIRALIDEKARLMRKDPPRGAASKQRFHSFRQINTQLQEHVAARRARLEQLLTELRPAARLHETLRGREFSFCLFPLDRIQRFMLEIRADET